MSAHSQQKQTVLTGVNAEYIAHLYGEYLAHPTSIDESWGDFFSGLNDNEVDLLRELTGASWTPLENQKSARAFGLHDDAGEDKAVEDKPTAVQPAQGGAPVDQDALRRAAQDSIQAIMLIRAYRVRGHMSADLDPLGLKEVEHVEELTPEFHGFSAQDYDRPIFIDGALGLDYPNLHEIIAALKAIYSDKIGLEYMHLTNVEERAWLRERIEEPRNRTAFSVEGKQAIFKRLVAAEGFEKFLHKKHPGTKRFGIDGGESLIPCIEQIMKRGGQLGLEEIVIGMAHRGRLNVLANIMGKPFQTIFAEFQGHSSTPDDVLGSGDVKYHLGTSSDRNFDGNNIHLSLTPNPSHLEFVNPVVIGKVRAKQAQREAVESGAVLPLILHGDAAFAGQGVTAETLMISELPGYRVGGTIHIVINNQIGFTTRPHFSRSGPYSTDVARMLASPIFHVNGDDPEAVVHVSRIATEFRQKFKRDVVIDMFCYRRFGHNEGDEPAFTSPLMYKKIAKQETTREKYEKKLIAEQVLSDAEAKEISQKFQGILEIDYQAVQNFKAGEADYLQGSWEGLKVAPEGPRRGTTAIDEAELQEIGKVLTHVPEGFAINRKLQRVLDAKTKMLETGEGFDWAMGEALAFASLLKDDFALRLSGQDVGRGTFSHRHAIWYDQENENKHIPLQHLSEDQPVVEIHDSPLSEMAVLGFEYGYASADPKTLVLWEAQFGDFANGAQVIFDQFISSGELKWLRMSALTVLLPHGYEGQGPEHSSGRPERFLQMSAQDNWQICNCTTPANYFHVLRRQMSRDFRKPLILFTPKSLLRHKLAVSTKDMFTGSSTFHRFLWDDDAADLVAPAEMKRVVLCTGKIYFDLLQERRKRGIKDVTIIRLEQLYPFATEELATELLSYAHADVVWCQEEPKNQGYWSFVSERIEEVLTMMEHKFKRPIYAGRPDAAAPATGLMSRHLSEQAKLIDEALSVE